MVVLENLILTLPFGGTNVNSNGLLFVVEFCILPSSTFNIL